MNLFADIHYSVSISLFELSSLASIAECFQKVIEARCLILFQIPPTRFEYVGGDDLCLYEDQRQGDKRAVITTILFLPFSALPVALRLATLDFALLWGQGVLVLHAFI